MEIRRFHRRRSRRNIDDDTGSDVHAQMGVLKGAHGCGDPTRGVGLAGMEARAVFNRSGIAS